MRSNCQTRVGLLPQALRAVRPLDTVRFIGARPAPAPAKRIYPSTRDSSNSLLGGTESPSTRNFLSVTISLPEQSTTSR